VITIHNDELVWFTRLELLLCRYSQ